MDTLYNLITGIVLLAASPYLLFRMTCDRTFRDDLRARFTNWKTAPPSHGCLWVHASSVGEVQVAKILIRALQSAYPDRMVVWSTFTATGFAAAQAENLCPVFRLPADLPFLTRPLLNRINPAMLILIEAEFWPGLLAQCRKRKLPVLLVNGRMSLKSFQRYRSIRPVFLWITSGITGFAVRTKTDAERLTRLGVAPGRVRVTGNMKFDALTDTGGAATLKRDPQRPLLVFGSTRPGDEAAVVQAVSQLTAELPDLSVAVVPRHLQRCEALETRMRHAGLKFEHHSRLSRAPEDLPTGVVLVDALGVLKDYYARATLAYVGGGFDRDIGGHNILEPAQCGVPVVFGPYMYNFEEEVQVLKESCGGVQIESPEELGPALHRLLTNPDALQKCGRQAAEAVSQHRGATARNLEWITQLFTERTAP